MKTIILTLLLLLPLRACFSPQWTTRTRETAIQLTNKVAEIDHELQELGVEIKPHVIDHAAHGFDRKESVVHRLRRELREKDKLYHVLLDEMEGIERRQTGMSDLKTVLQQTLIEVQQQNAMLRHKKEVSHQQQETLHDLLETIKCIHDDMVQANVFAVAWSTAEFELSREQREHAKLDQERESVRFLLWQATKLTGRRVKKLLKRILFIK